MNKLPNKLYERVTGTEHDCYYDNSKIESFLDWLLHQPEVYVE